MTDPHEETAVATLVEGARTPRTPKGAVAVSRITAAPWIAVRRLCSLLALLAASCRI